MATNKMKQDNTKKKGEQAMITLTEAERKFMAESIKLTLESYYKTAEFYSKYTSDISKKRTKTNKAMYLELVNAKNIKDRKKQQNTYIKHLVRRASFLNSYTSKDENKVKRCRVVASKIIELNKKLRRIKKEESQQA